MVRRYHGEAAAAQAAEHFDVVHRQRGVPDDVTEVRDGYECGLTLTLNDIKEGDVIEAYELVEKART